MPAHVHSKVRVAPPAPAPLFSAQRLLDGTGFNVLRFIVDAVMLSLSVVAAILGAHAANVPVEVPGVLALFPPLALFMLYLRGMYRTRLRTVILDGVAPVIGAISIAAMGVVAAVIFVDSSVSPSRLMARAWIFAIVYVGAGRILLALSQRRARSRGALSKPVLIVGAGVVGAHVARRLEEHPEYGLKPIGFLDADPAPGVDVVDRRAPVLGSPDDLAAVVERTGAEHLILAFTRGPDRGLVSIVRRCDELGVEVSLVPRLFESINERVALEHLGGLPLLGLRTVDPKGWQFFFKHAFDRVVAALSLVALSPLLGASALAVRLSSPGPILYRQRRVGRDGQVFDILKFRSMRLDQAPADFTPRPGDAPGGVEGEDRRTPIGRILRRSAIDELPQLFNVLRGEMSLVGPRPERPEFVSLFREDIDRYSDRHRVKSGLTGWAQVNGLRGQTSIADRIEWDNFYIENYSLWLDVKILMLTVVTVVRWGDEA
ncbi:MAG: exopolysaccharide biosynthesis polyprenyl glycosylphosphotransferase [Solirubrobacteraceae bacterium]